MPFPVAHGLLGASVAALSQRSKSNDWRIFVLGAFLNINPDFDYALNLLRISGGGWHHGFTSPRRHLRLQHVVSEVVSWFAVISEKLKLHRLKPVVSESALFAVISEKLKLHEAEACGLRDLVSLLL